MDNKKVKKILEDEIVRLKKRKKQIKGSDPFNDEARTLENSVEEDLDEQLDHLNVEVKVNFIKKQIIELRKALARLKIGKYGICEKCGKMIDTQRLAIKPGTTLCIDCEKELEA